MAIEFSCSVSWKVLRRTQMEEKEKNKADLAQDTVEADTCMPLTTRALEPSIFPSLPW